MAKLLYTMGEVAETLGESTSAVRYWSNYFDKFIKPSRNAKGNRLFHPEDVETLQQVQFLLKKQGMTLEGAAARLSRRDGTTAASASAHPRMRFMASCWASTARRNSSTKPSPPAVTWSSPIIR